MLGMAASWAVGCDGSSVAPPPDFATEVQPILESQCLCHQQAPSGDQVAPVLTLNEGVAYDALVGVPSEQVPALARVEPGDPEASYLWRKVTDTHLDVGGSGTLMPPTGMLDAERLAVLESWIAGGALP